MPNIQTYYFEIHLKCCHLLWRLVELLKKGQKNLFWPWLQLKEGSESRSIRSGFSRTFFVLTFVTFISSLETPTDFKFVTRKQFIAFVLENHVGGFLTLLENWLRFHEVFFCYLMKLRGGAPSGLKKLTWLIISSVLINVVIWNIRTYAKEVIIWFLSIN